MLEMLVLARPVQRKLWEGNVRPPEVEEVGIGLPAVVQQPLPAEDVVLPADIRQLLLKSCCHMKAESDCRPQNVLLSAAAVGIAAEGNNC